MAKGRKLPVVLTDAEIDAILACFNRRYFTSYRNSLMVRTGLATRMRISEILKLKYEDMRLMGMAYRVHIHDAKSGKDRILSLPADLGAELGKLAKRQGCDCVGLVFTPTANGAPIQSQYIRGMMKRIGKRAGVPGFTPT